MPIIYDIKEPITFEEFLNKHDITITIKERPLFITERLGHKPERYYASPGRVEVSEPGVLVGVYGNGSTPEEAIKDLARRWRGQLLIKNGWNEDREEFFAPNEWAEDEHN